MQTLEHRVGKFGKGIGSAVLSLVTVLGLAMSREAKADMPMYNQPENVVSINTAGSDDEPELSCNGQRMYFGRSSDPEDLMQARVDGMGFIDIQPIPGVNTPTNAEASPTLSCDELEIIFTSWPIGSNPGGSADLYLGVRLDITASFVVRRIDELTDTGNYEGGATFFDNDLRIAFDRSCDCALDFRGIYEAKRDTRGSPFVEVRKWDEFDALGIGNVGLGGISRDGLRAMLSCYNCTGGSGDWDLIYASRPDLDSRFTFLDRDGNIQFLNINSSIVDVAASFIPNSDDIYFSSTRPGTMGMTDIWRAIACNASEISPIGSPYPLRVVRNDQALDIFFEEKGTACNHAANLYVGALTGFPNIIAKYCHLPGATDPNMPGMRYVTLPMGAGNEFFLVTDSTFNEEGSPGFDSSGTERSNIFNSCGPTP